jgi:hypothetical protein
MIPDLKRVRHLDLFNKLGIPKNSAIFLSSAIMAVYGLRENGDLDIGVTQPIFKNFISHPEFKLKKSFFSGAPKLKHKSGAIEMLITSGPDQLPTKERLWNETICISGYHFLKFESVIDSKLWVSRDKDLDDVRTIQEFLSSDKGAKLWHS